MESSRLSLHIWPTGAKFPLPSLNADCLAAIAYFQLLWRLSSDAVNWTIVSDWETSKSPNGQFPMLKCSCGAEVAGISAIFDHVGTCSSVASLADLNKWMSEDEKADCNA
jgi:hypothetical protein